MENVRISKLNELSIQIHTDNKAYIADMKNYFCDYVEGYRHMMKFKSGFWNGKICLMAANRSLPYGLLFDTIRFHKTNYNNIELIVDNDVKEFFTGVDIDPEYDLNIFPRPYQLECIEACLKHRSGIIVAATASGKSGVITYIIKALMDSNNVKKTLIIVPTVNLVTQFHADMIEYGMSEDIIGRVYSKMKEFDKPIVVSTWQTLSKNIEMLEMFDCVICDEVHSAKSTSIKTILSKCVNAKFRYGFTGTMPPSKLDIWNVKSYLGPILKTFGAAELADLGYISHCNVNYFNIEYNDKEKYNGEYNDVKDMIFTNPNRLHYIKNILSKLDGNVLVLVGKVEKEGQLLKDYLDKHNNTHKEVVFIWGDTKPEEREHWRIELGKRKNIILIATYSIMSVGVNIPSLKYILFASPFKSKIRTLQSIGRSLRKHDSKEYSTIFDIADDVLYLSDHALKRRRFYASEKFEIHEEFLHENLLAIQ